MIVGYVFGYGSLVHPADWALRNLPGPTLYGYLQGHRRTWDVAFNNSSALYDRKHYRDLSGRRIESSIAALGIYRSEKSLCNGLAIPVTAESLRLIDQREISYKRVDVSDFWETDIELPLWTYYPEAENRKLYKKELENNRVILPRHYFDICREAFRHWRGLDDFQKSTDVPTCPIQSAQFWRATGAL